MNRNKELKDEELKTGKWLLNDAERLLIKFRKWRNHPSLKKYYYCGMQDKIKYEKKIKELENKNENN